MTAFPTPKLTTIVANRAARADTVRDALRIAGENVYCLDAIIAKVLPLVEREADEFRDYLGEPLPPHATNALHLEIGNWRLLQDSLDLYLLSDPTEEDAVRYVRNVRQFLGYQHDLLMLETELLQSCLVHHYQKQLDRIAALTSKVPL